MIDIVRDQLNRHIDQLLTTDRETTEALQRRRQAERDHTKKLVDLTKEDLAYLKDIGVIDAFKEAATILRRKYSDVTLEVATHLDTSYFTGPSIDLNWHKRQDDRSYFVSDRVWCRATREAVDGPLKGVALYGGLPSSEILYSPQFDSDFAKQLVTAVRIPGRSSMQPPSFATRLQSRVFGAERAFNRIPHL